MERYPIIDVVGKGSFGLVAECLDVATGRAVAVKKLLDSKWYPETVVREISVLHALKHDHVMPMVEAFRHGSYVYIVFPCMRSDLYKYLKLKGGVLTEGNAKRCMYQVLKGLAYVHSQNFVHRDLKPENILVSVNGVIKICDFGLCRKHWETDRTLDMSENVGTLWYQAPEMLMGNTKYDATVDIWPVGIMLTELIDALPLVTQDSDNRQLSSLVKVLEWRADDLVDVNEYLRNSGTTRNFETRRRSSSKSYALASTAAVLRKLFPWWTRNLLDIVANCLQLNPANRKNAAQLLNMKFFTEGRFSSNYDKVLELKIKNDNMT